MQKGWIYLKISIILLLSMLFLGATKVPIKSGGRVTHLSGNANVKIKQILTPGQVIITGNNGRVELTFSDGSRLRVGPASHLQLIAYRPSPQHIVAKLSQGKLWSQISPGPAKKILIEGRHSIAAVMGTTYALTVTETETTTTVLQGQVAVRRPFPLESKEELSVLEQVPATTHGSSAPVGPPHEISKPFQVIEKTLEIVPGPYEVSPDQWLQIIQNQRINMRDNGQAQVDTIDPQVLASADEWFAWNQRMDTQMVKTE